MRTSSTPRRLHQRPMPSPRIRSRLRRSRAKPLRETLKSFDLSLADDAEVEEIAAKIGLPSENHNSSTT